MKKTAIILFLPVLIAFAITARAGWDWNRLAGGVALETVIVDETSIRGVWILEKSCGLYWVNWLSGEWQDLGIQGEYDAYYAWWMGGDEHLCGLSPSQYPYMIAVTYQGTHLYKYTSGWQPTSSPQSFQSNKIRDGIKKNLP